MNYNERSQQAAIRVERWLDKYNNEPESAMSPGDFVQTLDKELGVGEVTINRKLSRFGYKIRFGELVKA